LREEQHTFDLDTDGQTLFFYSDRNGIWNIFRQSLHERNARDFAVGPGEQTEPRLSPDAAWVLFWNHVEKKGQPPASMRLLRVPISGGAPEPVIETSSRAAVRCALGHSACVLSEFEKSSNKLIFSTVISLKTEKRSGEA